MLIVKTQEETMKPDWTTHEKAAIIEPDNHWQEMKIINDRSDLLRTSACMQGLLKEFGNVM